MNNLKVNGRSPSSSLKRRTAHYVCVSITDASITVAEADAYPMPRVDDLIDLGKSKYVTTLDLARGYWQVPVEKESRPLTAFATPVRAVRVMPFGAPATFQRMMDSVVRECYPYAAAYLDDVVIHSANWEDHTCHIRRVLQKLRDAGLTVKPKKCQLAMSRCTYLGHVVGSGRCSQNNPS